MRGVAAVAGVVLLSGCAGHAPSPEPGPAALTVAGEVTLHSTEGVGHVPHGVVGTPCLGRRWYNDIARGTPVVVRDRTGTQIALGALGDGRLSADPTRLEAAPCRFRFAITGVPDRGSSYTIEIGTRHLYEFTRSEASALAFEMAP